MRDASDLNQVAARANLLSFRSACMLSRRLIVNADDFGLTEGVNAGIVEAFQKGVLRSASLMANGRAFDDAVRLALENPGLDVGCHLMLISGRAVSQPDQDLPGSAPRLVARLAWGWRAEAIEREFAAQIEKIQATGVSLSHLDTHKHTHLAPPVLEAVLRVARSHDIPWVRRPFDLPLTAARGSAAWTTRFLSGAIRPLRGHFSRKLASFGCRATDHFAGFQVTGRFHAPELVKLIRALPEGLTEFMCHPGYCTEELLAAETRLKPSRQKELEALISPEVNRAVAERGIEVVAFREA